MTVNSKKRGIRNNNPGNIRWGDDWQGLVAEADRTDKAFCQFISPEYGIRAMIIILRNYQTKHGLDTIRKIVHRWAPDSENDTQAYISSMVKQTGIPADQYIQMSDTRTLLKLIRAIIRHENGSQPYKFDVFCRALELAGG